MSGYGSWRDTPGSITGHLLRAFSVSGLPISTRYAVLASSYPFFMCNRPQVPLYSNLLQSMPPLVAMVALGIDKNEINTEVYEGICQSFKPR